MPSLLTRQKVITPQLQEIRKLANKNPDRFVQKTMKIADLVGNVVPFHYNWAQRKYASIIQEEEAQGKPVRLFILKWRRAGITSCESARDFAKAWSRDNARIGIIAHLEDRAQEILQNYNFYYESLDPELQMQKSRDNIFGIKFEKTRGQVLIATAENPIKVRGDGIHWLHGSEAAHWGYQFNAVMQEVAPVVPPKAGTGIILETTGSIRGSQAHQHWQASKQGQTEFRAEFLCWLDDPEAIVPFTSAKHKDTVLSEIHNMCPRLTEKNKFYNLTPEQIHKSWEMYRYQSGVADFDYFCREFPYTEEEAWSSGGSSFFDTFSVNRAKPQKPELICVFQSNYINQVFKNFDDLNKVSHINDYNPMPHIKVWSYPSRNGRYLISADSALGESYGDYSAGYVIDIGTREMMAAFHGRMRPDETAHIMVSLAKVYNNALLVPESNPGGGGMTILQDIQRIDIRSNIYHWRLRDSAEGLRMTDKLGWYTGPRSRPMMLGELRKVFLDCINGRLPQGNIFKDEALFNEMRTFCPDPNSNIPRALTGCYDDRVIGIAIAHQAAYDEAFCTSKDLIYAYHKYQAAQPISQERLRQRVKPSEVFGTLMGGRSGNRGMGSNSFEIDSNGRITGCPDQ